MFLAFIASLSESFWLYKCFLALVCVGLLVFATSGVLRSGEFYWVISFWCFVVVVSIPLKGLLGSFIC